MCACKDKQILDYLEVYRETKREKWFIFTSMNQNYWKAGNIRDKIESNEAANKPSEK